MEPTSSALTGGPISFQNLGTSSVTSIDVIWYLVMEDYIDAYATTCDATGVAVPTNARIIAEHRRIKMHSDKPYRVARSLTVPLTAATGRYRLCVEMDPYDLVAETDETDNTVIMDMIVEVTL